MGLGLVGVGGWVGGLNFNPHTQTQRPYSDTLLLAFSEQVNLVNGAANIR